MSKEIKTFKDANDAKKWLVGQGMTDDAKLNGYVGGSLPETGQFVDHQVINLKKPTEHIRLITETGERISIGSLLGRGFVGTKEDAEDAITILDSGFYGLPVTTSTKLADDTKSSQSAVLAMYAGRKFKATKKAGFRIRFKGTRDNPEWCVSPEEAVSRLEARDFYTLEIVP